MDWLRENCFWVRALRVDAHKDIWRSWWAWQGTPVMEVACGSHQEDDADSADRREEDPSGGVAEHEPGHTRYRLEKYDMAVSDTAP